MGLLQKAGKFLGIDKFGKGLAAAGRVIGGEVNDDIESQVNVDKSVQKLLYAANQEKDQAKKNKLLSLLRTNAFNKAPGADPTAESIDPNLTLTNKEILGSAANVVLNVATPGAFKGSKAAILGKNALQGAGFGLASGLEKDRSAGGIVGSTIGGGITGGVLGATGLLAKAAKEFVSVTTPNWLMNKAVTPTLTELKKNVRYGTKPLGEELLQEGVKGGPKRLLEIADQKTAQFEDELQGILTSPGLEDAVISRQKLKPYLTDLVAQKARTPGLQGDAQRIKSIVDSMPEQLTLKEANQMKRDIYTELRDPAYKLDAKLSTKGAALKQIARGLKTEIENTVGGTVVKDINRKLSIYGRLQDTITDQMARSMKNNALGLTDALLLIAGGTGTVLDPDQESKPLGLLAALLAIGARHNTTAINTTAANILNKGANVGTGVVGSTAKAVGRRATLNLP